MFLTNLWKSSEPLEEIDDEEFEPLTLNADQHVNDKNNNDDTPTSTCDATPIHDDTPVRDGAPIGNYIAIRDDVTARTNKILLLLVIILFAVILSSPAEKNKIRKERSDKQLKTLSESIQKQKEILIGKYNNLKLMLRTENSDLDVVNKEYHEEQLEILESVHQEEIDKLHKDHQAELSNKQKEIDMLNIDLNKHKNELLDVKSQLKGLIKEENEFCGDCIYDVGGLRTTCGHRLEYLVSKYNGAEGDYKDAIIEVEPNCKKNVP